jgi:hypothetical protein
LSHTGKYKNKTTPTIYMLDSINFPDADFWNEIKIDYPDFAKKHRKMKNIGKSFALRVNAKVYGKVVEITGLEKNESKEKFWNNVHNEFPEFSLFLYLVLHSAKKINEDILKKIYEKNLHKDALGTVQEKYFELAIHANNKDYLRQIHYTTLLDYDKYIICEKKEGIPINNIDTITDDEAQELIRSKYKGKNKSNINVWYVLKTDDGLAFFVYQKAKIKKPLPTNTKRRNQFINYAKPLVIYLTNNYKELRVYSTDIERGIKYASAMLTTRNKTKEDYKKAYENTFVKTAPKHVDNFITNVIDGKIPQLQLKEVKFSLNQHDADITVTRRKDDLKKLLKIITENNKVKLNSSTVGTMKVHFENRQFTINFMKQENVIAEYSLTGKFPNDIAIQFEKLLNANQVKVNKKR